eukprot:129343-Prymnesium_polylepis.1
MVTKHEEEGSVLQRRSPKAESRKPKAESRKPKAETSRSCKFLDFEHHMHAGPMCISPPAGTHVITPELCGVQLGHLARR